MVTPSRRSASTWTGPMNPAPTTAVSDFVQHRSLPVVPRGAAGGRPRLAGMRFPLVNLRRGSTSPNPPDERFGPPLGPVLPSTHETRHKKTNCCFGMRCSRPLVALPIVLAVALGIAALAPAARADILITIDKSTQPMTVVEDGALLYTWPVSTGAPATTRHRASSSRSAWRRDHFSREWDDAPMPNSIFFTTQGHAIHGSEPPKASAARPRTAACGWSRRTPRILFDLVKQEGMANTKVVLTGETPEPPAAPVARRNQDKRSRAAVASVDDDDDVTGDVPPPRRVHVVPRGWRSPSRTGTIITAAITGADPSRSAGECREHRA